MKYDKIMAGGNLENIMVRLHGCKGVIKAIGSAIPDDAIVSDALYGAADLLEMICRDFQADIDAAEDYTGKGATV